VARKNSVVMQVAVLIIEEGTFIADQPLQYKVKDGNMDRGMALEQCS
jgi:hypothetical protein